MLRQIDISHLAKCLKMRVVPIDYNLVVFESLVVVLFGVVDDFSEAEVGGDAVLI